MISVYEKVKDKKGLLFGLVVNILTIIAGFSAVKDYYGYLEST